MISFKAAPSQRRRPSAQQRRPREGSTLVREKRRKIPHAWAQNLMGQSPAPARGASRTRISQPLAVLRGTRTSLRRPSATGASTPCAAQRGSLIKTEFSGCCTRLARIKFLPVAVGSSPTSGTPHKLPFFFARMRARISRTRPWALGRLERNGAALKECVCNSPQNIGGGSDPCQCRRRHSLIN